MERYVVFSMAPATTANGIDVYIDGTERGKIVVGGSARTVGAAGGYLTGGGHSPFAHFYGLAVDSMLIPMMNFVGKELTLYRST